MPSDGDRWDDTDEINDLIGLLRTRLGADAGRSRDRKCRLFGAGCCRLVWPNLTETGQRLVDVVEEHVDGGNWDPYSEAAADAHETFHRPKFPADRAVMYLTGSDVPAGTAERVAEATAECATAAKARAGKTTISYSNTMYSEYQSSRKIVRRQQVALARCVFGNPFRLVSFEPSWRTEPVVGLARQMYQARDFGPMPVLADALQDAGCEQPDILAHCRGDGPHVRGCWVVDLVLGKA